MCCCTLDKVKIVVEIFVSIMGIVLGFKGISLIHSYKEKQLDSTFNFLSKFKVRLSYIDLKFDNATYQEHILDSLIVPKLQNTEKNFVKAKNEIIPLFKNDVLETLSFLMNTDNQVPNIKGWTKNINKFVEFLETLSIYMDGDLYMWGDSNIDDKKVITDFYVENKKIIKDLLKDIEQHQTYIENKIAKKRKSSNV